MTNPHLTDQCISEPNPLDSDVQHDRFYHLDTFSLDDVDLADEFHHLRPKLWGLPLDSWFRERVAWLEEEIQRRQFSTSPAVSKRKPKLAKGVKL